jgi:hypothetical protein
MTILNNIYNTFLNKTVKIHADIRPEYTGIVKKVEFWFDQDNGIFLTFESGETRLIWMTTEFEVLEHV